jgi:hypothetical protein
VAKALPPQLHSPFAAPIPRIIREAHADALKVATREFLTAQAALADDDSEAARARHARALGEYERLRAQLAFIAAGARDV